jgi:hypothetical protein
MTTEIKIEIKNPIDTLPLAERLQFQSDLKALKTNQMVTAQAYSTLVDDSIKKGDVKAAQASIIQFKKYQAFLKIEAYKKSKGNYRGFTLSEMFGSMM